jgi:hypothetical protein
VRGGWPGRGSLIHEPLGLRWLLRGRERCLEPATTHIGAEWEGGGRGGAASCKAGHLGCGNGSWSVVSGGILSGILSGSGVLNLHGGVCDALQVVWWWYTWWCCRNVAGSGWCSGWFVEGVWGTREKGSEQWKGVSSGVSSTPANMREQQSHVRTTPPHPAATAPAAHLTSSTPH